MSASTESNKHNSTCVAYSENSAKLTPFPSHVAPSGYEFPGHTRIAPPSMDAVRTSIKAQDLTHFLKILLSQNISRAQRVRQGRNVTRGESHGRCSRSISLSLFKMRIAGSVFLAIESPGQETMTPQLHRLHTALPWHGRLVVISQATHLISHQNPAPLPRRCGTSWCSIEPREFS